MILSYQCFFLPLPLPSSSSLTLKSIKTCFLKKDDVYLPRKSLYYVFKKKGCKTASTYDCTSINLPIHEPTCLHPGRGRTGKWLCLMQISGNFLNFIFFKKHVLYLCG